MIEFRVADDEDPAGHAARARQTGDGTWSVTYSRGGIIVDREDVESVSLPADEVLARLRELATAAVAAPSR